MPNNIHVYLIWIKRPGTSQWDLDRVYQNEEEARKYSIELLEKYDKDNIYIGLQKLY